MKRTLLLLLVMAGARVAAHHPAGDLYLETQEITIAGSVEQCVYREPHTFLHLMTRDKANRVERWIVEGPGAGAWRRAGVGVDTVKPGDRVTVTGNPGRVPADRRLLLKAIVRPQDGWRWPATPR
jgi:hypothetical protein